MRMHSCGPAGKKARVLRRGAVGNGPMVAFKPQCVLSFTHAKCVQRWHHARHLTLHGACMNVTAAGIYLPIWGMVVGGRELRSKVVPNAMACF